MLEVMSALALGFATAEAGIASAENLANNEPITLSFGRTVAGHYTLDLALSDRSPLPFIFDTAASHTSLVEPLAVELDFTPTGQLYDVQTVTEAILA